MKKKLNLKLSFLAWSLLLLGSSSPSFAKEGKLDFFLKSFAEPTRINLKQGRERYFDLSLIWGKTSTYPTSLSLNEVIDGGLAYLRERNYLPLNPEGYETLPLSAGTLNRLTEFLTRYPCEDYWGHEGNECHELQFERTPEGRVKLTLFEVREYRRIYGFSYKYKDVMGVFTGSDCAEALEKAFETPENQKERKLIEILQKIAPHKDMSRAYAYFAAARNSEVDLTEMIKSLLDDQTDSPEGVVRENIAALLFNNNLIENYARHRKKAK